MRSNTPTFMSSNPDGSATLHLRIVPNAKHTKSDGIIGSQLKLRIHAPPVDGKANKEVIRFLAEILDIRKSQIRITAGETSRDKTVTIAGVPAERNIHHDLLRINR